MLFVFEEICCLFFDRNLTKLWEKSWYFFYRYFYQNLTIDYAQESNDNSWKIPKFHLLLSSWAQMEINDLTKRNLPLAKYVSQFIILRWQQFCRCFRHRCSTEYILNFAYKGCHMWICAPSKLLKVYKDMFLYCGCVSESQEC